MFFRFAGYLRDSTVSSELLAGASSFLFLCAINHRPLYLGLGPRDALDSRKPPKGKVDHGGYPRDDS